MINFFFKITIYIQELFLKFIELIHKIPIVNSDYKLWFSYLAIMTYFFLFGIILTKFYKKEKKIIFTFLFIVFLWQLTALIMLIIGVMRKAP